MGVGHPKQSFWGWLPQALLGAVPPSWTAQPLAARTPNVGRAPLAAVPGRGGGRDDRRLRVTLSRPEL